MRGEVTRKIMFNDMLKNLEVKQAQLDVLQTRNEQLMEDVKSLTSSISVFRTSMKKTCSEVLLSVDRSACIDGGTNQETLNKLIGDFDYLAKPSIDQILDPFGPINQELASPLVPMSLNTMQTASHENVSNSGNQNYLGFDLNCNVMNSNNAQASSLPPMPSTNSDSLI